MFNRRNLNASSEEGRIPAPGGAGDTAQELRLAGFRGTNYGALPEVGSGLPEELEAVEPVKPVKSQEDRASGTKVKESRAQRQTPVTSSPAVKPVPPEGVNPDEGKESPEDSPMQAELFSPPGMVETLRGARANSREKIVEALRELTDAVDGGSFSWELLRPDHDSEAKPQEPSVGERSYLMRAFDMGPSTSRDSRQITLQRPDQAGSFSEGVVSLAKEIACGRALIACPSWLFFTLFFLAVTCLALIAEQGLLHAGFLMHFLVSKVWVGIKLGLAAMASLSALFGLFYTLFGKPTPPGKRVGVVLWPDE
jgi:hypothetical protein